MQFYMFILYYYSLPNVKVLHHSIAAIVCVYKKLFNFPATGKHFFKSIL